MSDRLEKVLLNPEEVAYPDRIERDLHKGNIMIGPDGPDWGDQAIEAFMAKRKMGQVLTDSEWPNRIIRIPLMLGVTGSLDAARKALQSEVSRINEEGGTLKRELIGGDYGEAGDHLFADLVKASLHFTDGTPVASDGFEPNAELTLEALPDFYGEEQMLEAFSGTAGVNKNFEIAGDMPGRLDMEVSDESGVAQCGTAFHVRCRNNSSATTAQWRYQAEDLTPVDLAAEFVNATASGGKSVRHTKLGVDWTPVLSLKHKSSGYLTHTGVYDVWARVYSGSSEAPYMRLLYDVGDTVAPNQNKAVRLPDTQNWYLVNLGQINLQKALAGEHRWDGIIQARGETEGLEIQIDRLFFFCGDESSGIITANFEPELGLNTFKARDNAEAYVPASFITGQAPPVGGAYAALTGSDASDFVCGSSTWPTTSQFIYRSAIEDTGAIDSVSKALVGRAIGFSGFKLTDTCFVTNHALRESEIAQTRVGHIVRCPSAGNFISVTLKQHASGTKWVLDISKCIAGTLTPLKQVNPTLSTNLASGVTFRLATMVIGTTVFVFMAEYESEDYTLITTYTDAVFGTTLKEGSCYIYDECVEKFGVPTHQRYVDNIMLWIPTPDAIIYPSRSARITSLGAARQDSTGTAYSAVSWPGSDYPRIPVSGPEGRKVELAVLNSRGDFKTMPDSGLDALVVAPSYRPCWSHVPE